MGALSQSAKRFFNFHNIQFQWSVIGFTLICIALWCVVLGAPLLACIPAFIAGQFVTAAITGPMPLKEPFFVRQYEKIGPWIRHMTNPGAYVKRDKSTRIVRQVWVDFAEVYDTNGVLLGYEQTFDDYEADGHVFERRFTPTKEKKRLPMIALFRTPRQQQVSFDAT